MKIVRYTSQERVDLPDITAMSFLVLGEFRRTIRSLLQGPGAVPPAPDARVVRGFAVTPAGPPDTTVTVTMDPGGGAAVGVAISAENLGAVTDHGQLVGGRDSAGALEGQALQVLDFTGQPADTYTIEMRAVNLDSSTGENDNRAFWNPATNAEFIAEIDTRFLPQWEAQFTTTPVAGDEWITLATVVWDTVSIDGGDITDLRALLFEGSTPFFAATQAAYAALPDFDRGVARATTGVNEVYPVLRALGRQIADLKGQDSVGQFNWFNRTYGPPDLGAALGIQTKSLRTVDTVMFTVGDGATSFGDFNGATGLEDCLQHIEDLGSNAPNSIEIVCKSRSSAVPTPFTWPVTTAHAMNASVDRLVIDFLGNRMDADHPVSTSAIEIVGELEIRNLVMDTAPANDATIFEATRLMLFNCRIIGTESASPEPVVIGSVASVIEDCVLNGIVEFTNPNAAPSGTDNFFEVPVRMRGSRVQGVIEVTTRTTGEKPLPLHMSNCVVRMGRTDGYGRSAAIDINQNAGSVIEGCEVTYVPDVDGITTSVSAGVSGSELRIDNCRFIHSDVAASGTGGRAIDLNTTDRVSITNCVFEMDTNDGGAIHINNCEDVLIRGCNFRGFDVTGRAAADPAISLDSGVDKVTIESCLFDGWEPNVGAGTGRTILATASAVIDQLTVHGCDFRSCGGYCVKVSLATSCDLGVLNDNSVRVDEADGLGFDVENWTRGAIVGNTMFFATATVGAIAAGSAVGDAVCASNRVHNGTITATVSAVLYGAANAAVTDMNYVT